MTLAGGAAIEVGCAHRVGNRWPFAFRHRARQGVKRIGIAIARGFFEPGARLNQISRDALAAEIERTQIELRAFVAGLGGLVEKFGGARVVARRAGALREGQRQAMGAFEGAAIDRALQPQQAFLCGAPLEQDDAQPGDRVGIAGGGEWPQGRFRLRQVARPIGDDRWTQRLGDI